MHCNCCDKILTESEIIYNEEMGNYEPCMVCLEIALDAAYSGDFSYDEDDDSEFDIILDEDWDNYGDDLLPHPDQRWPY